MRFFISLLPLTVLIFSRRGESLQMTDPKRNDKHSGIDTQSVDQFVAPSLYETAQVVFEFTVWGLNCAGAALEMMKDWGGLGDLCPYSPEPVDSVGAALALGIKSQPLARKAITSAVEAWEFDFDAGKNQPLVMALTGPTGVGKTEVCSGHAVVLFDEVQKIVPGTLDVFMEAMGEHPVLTYYSNGHTVTVDASRVIFILVSDIGAEAILDVLLRYPSREEVPLGKLRSVVKKALDKQWERLQFGKVVDRVVPYLPMGPREILQVMELKLSQLEESFKGKYFSSLHTTAELRWHLCSRAYIEYGNFSTSESLDKGISHLFAVYGARNIENDGPLKLLKSKMLMHLQPWHPDQGVDVTYEPGSRHVIFRWCKEEFFSASDPDMDDSTSLCEVVWEGHLHEHHITTANRKDSNSSHDFRLSLHPGAASTYVLAYTPVMADNARILTATIDTYSERHSGTEVAIPQAVLAVPSLGVLR